MPNNTKLSHRIPGDPNIVSGCIDQSWKTSNMFIMTPDVALLVDSYIDLQRQKRTRPWPMRLDD